MLCKSYHSHLANIITSWSRHLHSLFRRVIIDSNRHQKNMARLFQFFLCTTGIMFIESTFNVTRYNIPNPFYAVNGAGYYLWRLTTTQTTLIYLTRSPHCEVPHQHIFMYESLLSWSQRPWSPRPSNQCIALGSVAILSWYDAIQRGLLLCVYSFHSQNI